LILYGSWASACSSVDDESVGVADHQLDVVGTDVELGRGLAFGVDDLDDVAGGNARVSLTTS